MEKEWQSTPAFLPGDSHEQRSLVDYSPCGRKESDTSGQLNYHQSNLQIQCNPYETTKGIFHRPGTKEKSHNLCGNKNDPE